jgi:hypothetical protein
MMRKFLLGILAILLLIEEWIWDTLSVLGRFIDEHLGLERFENWLANTTPPLALLAISIPIILVTPLNIAAVMMLANGMILQGVALEIVAKVIGTVFIARFFKLSKTQLLTFRPIAWVYNTVTYWLRWAHEKIQATPFYQWVKKVKVDVKAKVAVWVREVKRLF